MIDTRHCLGDRFQYDGALQYTPPLGFVPADLSVVAELRKAHGGIKIGDLLVTRGVEALGDGVTILPFSVVALPDETLVWPPSPLVLTVTVSYADQRITSRPVTIRAHPRGE